MRDIIARVGDDVERLGQLRSLVGFYGYLQHEMESGLNGAALTAFSDNVVVLSDTMSNALKLY